MLSSVSFSKSVLQLCFLLVTLIAVTVRADEQSDGKNKQLSWAERKKSIENCALHMQQNDPSGRYGQNRTLALGMCTYIQISYERSKNLHRPTAAQIKWFESLGQPTTPGKGGRRRRRRDTPGAPGPPKRKEYRTLNLEERARFHSAVRALKSTLVDGVNQYDILVGYHLPGTPSRPQHGGPAFLPWHREFIFRFELALQAHDPSVSIPYWDSTLDHSLPSPEHSIMWHPHFMGGGRGAVTTGPFADFTVHPSCTHLGQTLRRNISATTWGHLYQEVDIGFILSKREYSQLVYPTCNRMESDHVAVHEWVGGHMSDPHCSTSDPLFWMHHAFVDCIWEDFRRRKQITDRETEYPEDTGPACHSPFRRMNPFAAMVNRDGLSNHYTENHYRCTPRRGTCSTQEGCGNPDTLWCDTTKRKCMSKIQPGGNCKGVPLKHQQHACYHAFFQCHPLAKICHRATLWLPF